MFQQIQYSLLLEDAERNVRKTFRDIGSLAESIFQYGLLQNLVVRPDGEGRYIVTCGSRRFRALRKLIDSNRFAEDGEVGCLVLDEDGEVLKDSFRNLVENLQRSDLPPWQVGRRYNELRDGGMSQLDIATQINRSQGHVSMMCQVAEGLHPEVIARLESLPVVLPTNQLLKLAKIYDAKTFEPSRDGQLRALERILKRGTRIRGKMKALPERTRVWKRYQKLKDGVRMPAHAMPYVAAILKYLCGDTKSLVFEEVD